MELAGFAGGQWHAGRFAKRRQVAARVRELSEVAGRQPITGRYVALELQCMVKGFGDFATPERMRETLIGLPRMNTSLQVERGIERRRPLLTSPRTAQTSPKPPVSARISRQAERPALAAPLGRTVCPVGARVLAA